MAFKVLGQLNPSAATLTDVYTVPAATEAVASSITVANRSGTDTTFRISVAPAGAADSLEHYICYDSPVEGGDLISLTLGITLETTDVVRVYATLATLSFNVFGQEMGTG